MRAPHLSIVVSDAESEEVKNERSEFFSFLLIGFLSFIFIDTLDFFIVIYADF